MVEIATITLGAMDNGAHFAYHVETMNCVEADAKVKAKVAAQLAVYKAAIAKEDDALKISGKSFTTDQITEADAQRDAMYMGLKQSVKGYQKMKDPAIEEAVKVLNQLFKDYGIAPSMQLDKETGLLTNLIGDLEGKDKTYVDTLGLGVFVTKLKEYNELVRKSISARNAEEATRQVGAMKVARAEVDDAYRLLIKYVNAYALIEGETDYASFIGIMNALILRYKRQVLRQKSASTGGNGGDSDTPGGGGGEAPDPIPGGDTPSGGGGETPGGGSTSGGDGEAPDPAA